MTVAERATATTPHRDVSAPESSAAAVPFRWQIYCLCIALSLTCNYVLGKDMAFDTLNYHLYLGFSALNDRFSQDYFAAGVLAYLNPYAYVPFYALVRAGLPALAICSIFAVIHSIILWLSFELGVVVCPSGDSRTRLFAGICAVALAFMSPILMQQIGSCFADITTAELTLFAWLLLARDVQVPRISRVLFAGLLLGAASALKLSNAVAAASAIAMVVMLPLGWHSKIRHVFFYGVSLFVGFSLVAAPWSYRLAKAFGNPLFPMFNNFFRSPYISTEPGGPAYRFIPDSMSDALWRPFAMIDPVRMVHEELSAPDLRYAALITLAFLFALCWGWRRFRQPPPSPRSPRQSDANRVFAALGCALIVYWVLWLSISGNSRYVLTMSCVAAAVLVGTLFRVFESRPKVRNYVLGVILVGQAFQLYFGAEFRWTNAPWGGPWLDVSVPDKLKTQPNLYLTIRSQSLSFLAPFVAKDSGFVNVSGGYVLDPDSANGTRVRELMRKFSSDLRITFLTTRPFENLGHPARSPEVDDALLGYGLRPNMADCEIITINGLPPELEIGHQTPLRQQPDNRVVSYAAACRLVPDISDRTALLARRRAVDLVFDRLEDACPRLFQPRRLATTHYGDVWRRFYGSTDIEARIVAGRVKFVDQARAQGAIEVGREDEWAKAPLKLDCGKNKGAYFAHVVSGRD